jgi:protocatechuate 3,4-dioxygenase beta subunit
MLTAKLRIVTGLLLALGVAVAAGTQLRTSSAAPPPEKGAAPPRDTAPEKPAATVTVTGKVLAPDGRPVAGARIYLRHYTPGEPAYPVRATTDGAGRFTFSFDRSKLGPAQTAADVIAVADGYGPDWFRLGGTTKEDVTLRLAKEVPIRGRILDLDGKAVAGATLRVQHTRRYAGDDLKEFLRTVREGEHPPLYARWWDGPFPGQPKTITTGADGRFRLAGVGAESEVRFWIEGPGIQYGFLRAVTRELDSAVGPKGGRRVNRPHIEKVHGATFVHAVAPSRLIRGVVRDRKTGKPLAGVEISGPPLTTTHRTTTDKAGRYELKGYPKSSAGYEVRASAGGLPYFNAAVRFADTPGLGPIQGDVELVGGIAVRGRVTHQGTGKPIAGAWVEYNALFPNPHLRLLGLAPGETAPQPCSRAQTAADGSYTLVVLPGPGAVGVGAYLPKQPLMPACVTKKDLDDFFKDGLNHGDEMALVTQVRPQTMGLMGQNTYNHLALIRPDEKAKSLRHDVALQPERTLRGKVVGPDGKPIDGVRVYGLAPQSAFGAEELKGETFVVRGFNPRRKRELVFLHRGGQLGAYLEVLGEPTNPPVVRLEACGSVTGRIIDTDGQPVPGLVVRVDRHRLVDSGPKVKTDKGGRFRVNGLVPGQKYMVRLDVGRFGKVAFGSVQVKPGEGKDLGDATVDTTNPGQ